MLAKSSDKILAAIAQAELAGAKDADAQTKLAEAWIESARNLPNRPKSEVLAHALTIYNSALPDLTGPALAKAEAKIEALQSVVAPTKTLFERTEGPDLADRILKQLPQDLLPKNGDTDADLKTKNDALKKWYLEHPIVDTRKGTKATIVSKYIGNSINNVAPTASNPKPTHKDIGALFEIRSTYKEVPSRVSIVITRPFTSETDADVKQLKSMEQLPRDQLTTIVAEYDIVTVFLQKNSADQYHINIKLTSHRGPFSTKRNSA
jgi:hypothetical protein